MSMDDQRVGAGMSSEEQPLLGPVYVPHQEESASLTYHNDEAECSGNGGEEERAPTPLPMRQISILLLLQLAEPIAFTVIYPFVAELVNGTGITGGDAGKVGYYAGLIESIFFFTESMFTLQYGRLSDRIGRRPVLMFGLFGLSLSIFSFGLSKTFWKLVFTRALSGALNGNVGVAKSMMVELSDETNQAQCFSFLPIVWSTGSTLGPFIGGTLSHPAKLLPSVFDTPFWNEYPYFLPCLVAAGYAACVFVFAALFLQETLHTHTQPKLDAVTEYGAAPARPPPPQRAPSIRSVLTKRACIAITNYGFLAFSDITYLGLLPVVFAVSVDNGGLGLSPRIIGLILGLQGIVTGVVQLMFFAPIHKRFGNKRVYIAGYSAYALLLLSLPLMHILAKYDMKIALWTVIAVHILLSCPAFMSFSCIIIFVTSAAPSKSSLGTLNGISQTTISMIRAIGPASATSLFAFSMEKNLLGGGFVYVVLLAMSGVGLAASQWLKEEKRAH